MIKFFKNKVVGIFSFLFMNFIAVKSAYAKTNLENTDLENPIKEGDIKSFLLRIAKDLTWIAGIVFVIMLVYGGIKLMTAEGDVQNEEKAKNTLVWAVVGIIIVAVAFAAENYLEKILTPSFS